MFIPHLCPSQPRPVYPARPFMMNAKVRMREGLVSSEIRMYVLVHRCCGRLVAMPDIRTIVADNDASRERLKGICGRLAEVDLRRMVDGDWTGAAKLGYFVLWDQQA